jgi:hypothetical protein
MVAPLSWACGFRTHHIGFHQYPKGKTAENKVLDVDLFHLVSSQTQRGKINCMETGDLSLLSASQRCKSSSGEDLVIPRHNIFNWTRMLEMEVKKLWITRFWGGLFLHKVFRNYYSYVLYRLMMLDTFHKIK